MWKWEDYFSKVLHLKSKEFFLKKKKRKKRKVRGGQRRWKPPWGAHHEDAQGHTTICAHLPMNSSLFSFRKAYQKGTLRGQTSALKRIQVTPRWQCLVPSNMRHAHSWGPLQLQNDKPFSWEARVSAQQKPYTPKKDKYAMYTWQVMIPVLFMHQRLE